MSVLGFKYTKLDMFALSIEIAVVILWSSGILTLSPLKWFLLFSLTFFNVMAVMMFEEMKELKAKQHKNSKS